LYGQVTHHHAGANEEYALAKELVFLWIYEGDAVKDVQRDDAGHLRDDDPCLCWVPF
jgi:hypothetical protein